MPQVRPGYRRHPVWPVLRQGRIPPMATGTVHWPCSAQLPQAAGTQNGIMVVASGAQPTSQAEPCPSRGQTATEAAPLYYS